MFGIENKLIQSCHNTQYLKMKFLLIFTLIAALGSALADDLSPARLLVHKRLLNKYLVEGRDVVVDYNIYNIGESAAYRIQLRDSSFPSTDFETVIGFLNIKLDRMGPNSNISHTVILRPKRTGLFNFTAAEVTYLPSEDSQELQVSYSTEPGEAVIIPAKDFDRKFSPHTMDWTAFAVMTLPSLGIPFLLWYRSKSKYESVVKQKKH
ncbi:translocon-associated protein subunit beta [Trichonephila clavipes]|uniref:Translocon-associated protein subunit beta n=1 Tax=Trichonephila clavipes TaxID=2585209 RepID=A0A8X6RYL2_TRICX|nr:translocon-associated protein subunit beta [Trichonephila clavipes]